MSPETPAHPEHPAGEGADAPRAELNREAIDYYRRRSRAPGVREGGAERNFYCMRCDGVIPFDHDATACPHCGAPIEGRARRYFNWVEIDELPRSDLAALLPLLIPLLLVLAVLGWIVLSWVA